MLWLLIGKHVFWGVMVVAASMNMRDGLMSIGGAIKLASDRAHGGNP